MLYVFSIKLFRPAFRFHLVPGFHFDPDDIAEGDPCFIDYDDRYDSDIIQVEVGGGLRLADGFMKAVQEIYALKSKSNPNGWMITKISCECLGDDGGGRVRGDSGRGSRAIANLRRRFPLAFANK